MDTRKLIESDKSSENIVNQMTESVFKNKFFTSEAQWDEILKKLQRNNPNLMVKSHNGSVYVFERGSDEAIVRYDPEELYFWSDYTPIELRKLKL